MYCLWTSSNILARMTSCRSVSTRPALCEVSGERCPSHALARGTMFNGNVAPTHVLKDEIDVAVIVRFDHLEQFDYVLMAAQFLKEHDLSTEWQKNM